MFSGAKSPGGGEERATSTVEKTQITKGFWAKKRQGGWWRLCRDPRKLREMGRVRIGISKTLARKKEKESRKKNSAAVNEPINECKKKRKRALGDQTEEGRRKAVCIDGGSAEEKVYSEAARGKLARFKTEGNSCKKKIQQKKPKKKKRKAQKRKTTQKKKKKKSPAKPHQKSHKTQKREKKKRPTNRSSGKGCLHGQDLPLMISQGRATCFKE